MHAPQKLVFTSFLKNSTLDPFQNTQQRRYVEQYLEYLGTKTVIIEKNYFDNDYLDEFAHFYSKSSRGYENICERWHFFDFEFDREFFEKAINEQSDEYKKLCLGYLGFSVKRPLGISPFGHTVFAQFKNNGSTLPRIACSRQYKVHLAGIELFIHGLSWQQQDTAVSACATISIWTALHSASFDDYHAIPTTAQITLAAHKTASLGSRVFPSNGLSVHQVCEAVKELGLSPMLISGDNPDETFTKERFLASCCSLIASGYPVIVLGRIGNLFHAVCYTGHKPNSGTVPQIGKVEFEDALTDVFYMHDDNVGPYVRLKVDANSPNMLLKPEISPNQTTHAEIVTNYGVFSPMHIMAPVHDELRTSIDTLNRMALIYSNELLNAINPILQGKGLPLVGIRVGARFTSKVDYIQNEMQRIFPLNPTVKSQCRLKLWEDVEPMSYFIGVIRLQVGPQLFCDFLVDTTDNIHSNRIFASVCFCNDAYVLLNHFSSNGAQLGAIIQAF